MNIGNLLKKYRLEQGKTQVEFAGKVISRSYYAKIENEKHQIKAADLICLLDYNGIDLTAFFTQLDKKYALYREQILHQRKLMEKAYYKVDVNLMQKVKYLINSSELSQKDKEKQNLLIDGFMELLNVDGKPNVSLRRKMKEEMFDIPEFNQTKFMLYCNTMRFYTFADNNMISKQLVRRYKDTENIVIQKDLLSIVINMLVFSIEQDNLDDVEFYISYVDAIPTTPDILFYKNVIQFFESLIKYKKNRQEEFLKICDLIIESLAISGMESYSSELDKFKNKYK